MAKLLGRTSGWSDCEQLKQMEILFRVMNKTKTVKIGRGKKAYTKEEFVYQSESDDEVRAVSYTHLTLPTSDLV